MLEVCVAMSTGSRGGGAPAMSDMNVTPLVDVMLVLLIIFMVTAPMLTAEVEVDLPNEVAQPLPQEQDDQLVLSIDSELNYYIEDHAWPAEEMPAKLAAIAEANPDQVVYVRADGDVAYENVAFLLAAARGAGMPQIGLVFDPGLEELDALESGTQAEPSDPAPTESDAEAAP